MPTPYQQILAAREDMTEWLIHFTRGQPPLTARDVLLKILAEGLLRPGWALRTTVGNGVTNRTVFGPRPAVCFTEQPVGALMKYVAVRPMATPYGILVHKNDAFADGALPAIYGLNLAHELKPGDPAYVPGHRTLDPVGLPIDEQYRYVTLALYRFSSPHPIDWTHEREWRWSTAPRGHPIAGGFALSGSGTSSDLGLSEGRVHVFVDNDADVVWLKAQLLAAWTLVRNAPATTQDSRYRFACDQWFQAPEPWAGSPRFSRHAGEPTERVASEMVGRASWSPM
jgi:hypothetical protein